MSLKERLVDWTDLEEAEYYLAIELGVFRGDEEWVGIKWIFWSANKLGNGLYKALLGLVDSRRARIPRRTRPSGALVSRS